MSIVMQPDAEIVKLLSASGYNYHISIVRTKDILFSQLAKKIFKIFFL